MTQDEIIRMARDGIQSYLSNGGLFNPEEMNHDKVRELIVLCRDAIDLVAAHEREACAKVCEEIEQDHWNLYKGRPPYTGSESGRADPHEQGVSMGAGECAAAIRARGE